MTDDISYKEFEESVINECYSSINNVAGFSGNKKLN